MTEEQRAKRLHYHLYDSLEGKTEQSERIVELEEIAVGLYTGPTPFVAGRRCSRATSAPSGPRTYPAT